MINRAMTAGLAALAVLALVPSAWAGGTWADRSADLQNSGNVGNDPGLTFENVKDLQVVSLVPSGVLTSTPVVTRGLMVFGSMDGKIQVVDVNVAPPKVLLKFDSGGGSKAGHGTSAPPTDKTGVGHLLNELSNYAGVQSTGTLATVTVAGGAEELRAYIGTNSNKTTLWCINLSKVDADRASLSENTGEEYRCTGNGPDGNPAFPRPLSVAGFNQGDKTYHGAPMFSADQQIKVGDVIETRDVIYTPSTGLDCADGQMFAIDAYTGELLWSFDPAPGDEGGTIWTTPAMNAAKTRVYISTGDCVDYPKLGGMPESVVALDAATGQVAWFHQKRLIDAADLDIGTGIAVADVEGFQGCHVVVSSDKDGCIYGYNQEADIPEVGDLGYDPLRAGEQRVLWRNCFVAGSLNGGFNSSNGALWGRLFVQQASGYPAGHIGSDDSNAFAVDVCNGQVQWASSDISNGRTDAAIASDMLFQLGVTRKLAGGPDSPYQWMQEVTVAAVDAGLSRVPEVLATVKLPHQGTIGGGGVAIADGTLYIPTVKGVAIAKVVPGSNASPPVRRGVNVFAGPYPAPVSPGMSALALLNPQDPYPLMLRKPGAPELFRSLTEGGPVGVVPDGVVPAAP